MSFQPVRRRLAGLLTAAVLGSALWLPAAGGRSAAASALPKVWTATLVDGASRVDAMDAMAGVRPAATAPQAAATVRVETLMPGTRYETRLYVIDSGVPGPTVWISGGVHGSETAGWRAAEQVAGWRVGRGRLVVLPRANAPAIGQNRRYARGDTDLNRAFPIRGSDNTPDTALARAIWEAVQRHRPDVLVDLHEALSNHNTNRSSVGQTLIAMPATVSLGQRVLDRLNREEGISSRWRFTVLRYPVQGSLARAAGDFLGIRSGIFETSRQLPLSTRIRYQLSFVRILLDELGLQPQTAPAGAALPAAPGAAWGLPPDSRKAA